MPGPRVTPRGEDADLVEALRRAVEAGRAPGIHVTVVASKQLDDGVLVQTATTLPDGAWARRHLADGLAAVRGPAHPGESGTVH